MEDLKINVVYTVQATSGVVGIYKVGRKIDGSATEDLAVNGGGEGECDG